VTAVLDREAKKILKLKLPRAPEVAPRQFKAGFKKSRPRGYTPTSQKQLRALRDGAVKAGGVLNPYGKYGDSYRSRYRVSYFMLKLKPGMRDQAMKRKRLRLKEKKAIALEAHELQQMARENATAAMETLAEISKSKRAPEATRIAASAVILDRAYGKASQTSITANVTNGKTSEIDGNELSKRIDHALKRVADLTTRAPKAPAGKNRSPNLRKLH
jgi:hypothetical protein